MDAQVAATMGIPNAHMAWAEHLSHLDRFRRDVMPRLPGHLLPRAQALLTRLSQPAPTPTLVHADVGPEHILLHDGAVSGVIDWTDARIGDPAVDLAWLLHGSSAANAVAEAYGATAELFARASDWHLLGPWHEVIHGIDTNQPGFIDSGVVGVTARLER
jgi:aminoglycoside phosphotransferase (APT) family kinase protein